MASCLRKKLRKDYAHLLIDFHGLQKDTLQQQTLESAKTIRNQHDMGVRESISQDVKLRKYLFEDLWPNHVIDHSRNDREVEEEEDNVEEEEEEEGSV